MVMGLVEPHARSPVAALWPSVVGELSSDPPGGDGALAQACLHVNRSTHEARTFGQGARSDGTSSSV